MPNILIADDEKEIIRLLRIYLESDGVTVFEANDGAQALDILEKEDIDLALVDIIAESYCDFEDNGIELNIDIPDEAIMINADRSELKRALTNLIVNVYKHNPSNIRARISVAEESGRAEIRIADSGDPLPEGVDIFEPFVTENTARTVGRGTGLGLAVTKRVIERHGGEVKVRPAADGYTKEFVIRL